MSGTSPATSLLFLREEELRQGLELLFFAERDLEAEIEPVLHERGLGRLHHRVVQFVARQPSLTSAALTRILGLPKQTVSRIVQDLVERGLVTHRVGPSDRRQRPLSLTDAGRELERLLWDAQRRRVARAYRACGPEAVEGFRRVLLGMIDTGPERRGLERASAPGESR